MKYLYLLCSVIRGHFDKNRRKFTFSAMLMFFFSSFLMLFITSVIGSDILFSNEEEDWERTAYVFYTVDKNGKEVFIDANQHIFDELFSLKSNGIDCISVSAENCFDGGEKIGNKSANEFVIMPVMKEDYGERMLFDFWIGHDALSYYRTPCSADQNITEGAEITLQQLENEEYVIVLPEKWGVKVGEMVTISGEIFSVVGTTADDFARMPSYALEKLALDPDKFTYQIREINFKKPLDNKTYEILKKAVYESTGKELTRYEGRSLPVDAEVVYSVFMAVLGGIIALFCIFGIYYPTLRICRETSPTLSVFKMCGMKMLPIFGLLSLSVLICYGISFGLASWVIISAEGVFSSLITEYELKKLYFGFSAFLFIAVAAAALAPQMIKMAKSQPAEAEY